MATEEFERLDIKCTSSDCGNGLHCFKPTSKMRAAQENGRCRACGAELVDWTRIHRQQLGDVTYLLAALKSERWRHYFWETVTLDARRLAYARRKGRSLLRSAAAKRIRSYIGPAAGGFDGRQTPRETSEDGNVIHFAQHATAVCCRACVADWHGIPKDRPLTTAEIDYFTSLVMMYIDEKLPDLAEEPVDGIAAKSS
jgi:hypothetical protein